MAQAEAAAEDGKVPVLVMHEEQQEYGNSYAIMHLMEAPDPMDRIHRRAQKEENTG